jgi:hypothetical protein
MTKAEMEKKALNLTLRYRKACRANNHKLATKLSNELDALYREYNKGTAMARY